ncbi:hypothetical protein BDV96DRAFT_690107 [Lophiotrema nucula]|uniref:Uncharacterized protein n=1 Tax=Lophiotrema nucula TaxID=690887 RepID=A0A6A5YX18_9PLEO|nr:hypothetical protein BDV96DRAFT_690107 [Lophiotrema nucula]
METTMASITSSISNTSVQSSGKQPSPRKRIKLSDYRKQAPAEKVARFDEKLKQPKQTGVFRPEMMSTTTYAGNYEKLPVLVGMEEKNQAVSKADSELEEDLEEGEINELLHIPDYLKDAESKAVPPPPSAPLTAPIANDSKRIDPRPSPKAPGTKQSAVGGLESVSTQAAFDDVHPSRLPFLRSAQLAVAPRSSPPPKATVAARWDPSEKSFPPPAAASKQQPAAFAQLLPAANTSAHQLTLFHNLSTATPSNKDFTGLTKEKVLLRKVDKEHHTDQAKDADIAERKRKLNEQLEAIKATPIKPINDVVRDLLDKPLLEGIDYESRPRPQPRPFNKPTRLRQPRNDESGSERAYHEQMRTRRWHDVLNGRCNFREQETRFEFASTYSSLSMIELSDECALRGLKLHPSAKEDGSYLVHILQLDDHEYRKSLRVWKNDSKYELLEHDREFSEPIVGGESLSKEALANAMAKRGARLEVERFNKSIAHRYRKDPQWDIDLPRGVAHMRAAEREIQQARSQVPTPPQSIAPASDKSAVGVAKTTTKSSVKTSAINAEVIAKAKAKAAQIAASAARGIAAVAQPEDRKRKRGSSEREETDTGVGLTLAGLKKDESDSAIEISDDDSVETDEEEEERPRKKMNRKEATATRSEMRGSGLVR